MPSLHTARGFWINIPEIKIAIPSHIYMKRQALFTVFFLVALHGFGAPLPVKRAVLAPRNPATFEVHPSIAYNSRTKQSLVVWERHPGNHPGHSTWGRLLNPQGGTSGASFSIIPGFNPYTPSAVYNPEKNSFAMVYSDEGSVNGKMAVFIQRLNSKGRKAGAPVKVSTDDQSGAPINDLPNIVYHPGTGNYIIFWRRSGTSIEEGLYGAVFNANLARVTGPAIVLPLNRDQGLLRQTQVFDVKVHPISQKVVILYALDLPGSSASTNPKANYNLAALNPDLSAIRPQSFIKVNTTPVTSTRGASLEFISDGSGVLVYVDVNNLRMRRITPALRVTGGALPAFRSPLNSTRMVSPRLSFVQGAAGLRGVLVALRDPGNTASNGGIWMQQLDQAGKPSATPVEIEDDFDTANGLALSGVPANATANAYRFRLVYVQGTQQNLPPGPNESSGLILLNFGFTVP